MNMIGAAAARLKERLDMNYGIESDDTGRLFSGLHNTLLPMASKTRSIFQQLRSSKRRGKKEKKSGNSDAEASAASAAGARAAKMSGQVHGAITGVDLRHLLLLLPFLLFDLLDDEIKNFNENHGTDHINPAHILIKWVLLLLEWYHLYRYQA